MNKREPKEIVFAFIDSQNLNLGTKKSIENHNGTNIYKGWKLDFRKFRIYLKDKYKVEKAFLCIGHVAGNESLYTYLQESGYVLVFKPTLEYKSKGRKHIKGNVDSELVLHSMIQFNNYDNAVIVTGDGDFYCLIDYLKEQNKLARLIIPNRVRYSQLLSKFRKDTDFMNNLNSKLGKSKRGVAKST